MSNRKVLSISGKRPEKFAGELRLPASKSYLHRALFIASLANSVSRITDCGESLSEDVQATIRVLSALGIKIRKESRNHGTLVVDPRSGIASANDTINVSGSGTTARFAISFAALAHDCGETTITGDSTLLKRPVQDLLDALSQLGVECRSTEGKLPATVRGGGIQGGRCQVDASVSSQYVSSLLIACTRAASDCTIQITNPSKLVSEPYIDATLKVLECFGFKIDVLKSNNGRYSAFRVPANQKVRGQRFAEPGDMSSAASLIGAVVASHGRLELRGVNRNLPQSDSVILQIVRKLGAKVSYKGNDGLLVNAQSLTASSGQSMNLDLKEAPDLVPVVASLAAATGSDIKFSNVERLRVKESDRVHTLATALSKLGVRTHETSSTLSVLGSRASRAPRIRKALVLEPQRDHRMLMAFTIAGLSGRFGSFQISDPGCVSKSYPAFVTDIRQLCHDETVVRIVEAGERTHRK